MPYCTLEDIKDLISEADLIGLTDDADAGVVDTGIVDEAVADADAEIDSYCETRYSVPFTTVPPMIKKLSKTIAIYNLFSRRRGAPEDRVENYKNAVRFLEKVAEGKTGVGVQPPPDPPDDGDLAGQSAVSTRDKMFGTDTMDKY